MKKLCIFVVTMLTLFIMMIGFSASGRVYLRELITGIDEADGSLDPTPSDHAPLTASGDGESEGKFEWIPIDVYEDECEETENSGDDETWYDDDWYDQDRSDGGAGEDSAGDSSGEEDAGGASGQEKDGIRESADDRESADGSGEADTSGSSNPSSVMELIKAPVDESLYYYRTVLGDEELSLYDALYERACANTEDGKGTEITIHIDPSSEEFHTAFSRAYNALLFDHPELFWLTMSGGIFQYSYYRDIFSENTYKVRFKLSEHFTDLDDRIGEFEAAAAELLSGVDLDQPDPLVALQIHDRLIDTITYDDVLASSDAVDLAHTAYGALVCNSRGQAHTAVCDGYSYAYEYLLQKVGIPCIVLAGRAGEDRENAGSHSWNMVKLDDEWYEVDITWNDITIGGIDPDSTDFGDLAAEALISDDYMDLLHHFLFNVTTDTISRFVPGEDYRYTTILGWVSFLHESVHIRHSAEDTADTGDYMTQYAPVAEGTTYSYEAIRERWQPETGETDGE